MKKNYIEPVVEVVCAYTEESVMLIGSNVYESDASDDVLSRDDDEFEFE